MLQRIAKKEFQCAMRDYSMVHIHTSRIKIEKVLDIKGVSAAIDFQCGFWVNHTHQIN